MIENNFVFIDIEPMGNYDIQNMNKMMSPKCNKDYLKPSKFNAATLLCFECGLKITGEELKKRNMYSKIWVPPILLLTRG